MERLTLEETLAAIWLRHLVLAYDRDGSARLAWRYPALPAGIKRAIHNHRRGLATKMRQGDWRLCPVPLHKSEYYYSGRGQFACSLCQTLDSAQLGMWKAS